MSDNAEIRNQAILSAYRAGHTPPESIPPQAVPQEPHEIIKGACGAILTAMEQGSFTVPQSLFLYKFGSLLVGTTATALKAAGVNVSKYDVTKHTEPAPEQQSEQVAPESPPEPQPESPDLEQQRFEYIYGRVDDAITLLKQADRHIHQLHRTSSNPNVPFAFKNINHTKDIIAVTDELDTVVQDYTDSVKYLLQPPKES